MADQQAAPDTGQGVPAAPQGTPAPYFSFKGPDGKEETFNTRDELEKAWKDSYLRRSDYTRKTQEIGQLRKQHEKERAEFEEAQKALVAERKKYEQYAERLKQRPDVARQLEAMVSAPASPNDLLEVSRGYADEKYQTLEKQLKQLVEEREAEKLNRSLEETYKRLEEEFPDFNRESVEDILRELQTGDVEALTRLAYHAGRGMLSPAQVEKKLADNMAKKANAGMPRSSGNAPLHTPKTFKSVAEAREAALKDLGVT